MYAPIALPQTDDMMWLDFNFSGPCSCEFTYANLSDTVDLLSIALMCCLKNLGQQFDLGVEYHFKLSSSRRIC